MKRIETDDSTLAKSLGADEYGMMSYVFVLLTPGSNKLEKGEVRDSIFILNLKSNSEAKELLQTDTAIKAKVLDAELFEWYGSAAISEYLKLQKRITKSILYKRWS